MGWENNKTGKPALLSIFLSKQMIKPKLFFLVPVVDIYLSAYLATKSRKIFCQSMMPSAHQVNTCSGWFRVFCFVFPQLPRCFPHSKGSSLPPPIPQGEGKGKGRIMEEDCSGSCSGCSGPLDPGMATHHGLTLTSVWLRPLSEKASKDDFQVFSALKEKKRQKKIFLKRKRKKCLKIIPRDFSWGGEPPVQCGSPL